jgi:hypothetical protein
MILPDEKRGMTDHLTKAKRSWNMSRIRGKSTPNNNKKNMGDVPLFSY